MVEDWGTTVDDLGETPISRALKCGHSGTVTLILRIAEPANEEADTPLHRAARNSNVPEVRHQLEQGADINQRDPNGMTALHWAAVNGCMDLAKLLVNRGADVNARESMTTDFTPLTLAKWMGYDDIAELLVYHGGLP